jgi:hypothetical protein
MKNFQCDKCFEFVQANSMPQGGTCQVGSSSSTSIPHRWKDMGEAGTTLFECGNCGETLHSRSSPMGGACKARSGNGTTVPHNWRKLA